MSISNTDLNEIQSRLAVCRALEHAVTSWVNNQQVRTISGALAMAKRVAENVFPVWDAIKHGDDLARLLCIYLGKDPKQTLALLEEELNRFSLDGTPAGVNIQYVTWIATCLKNLER